LYMAIIATATTTKIIIKIIPIPIFLSCRELPDSWHYY
jgi:hypothetical protein